mmetsp:Transcript_27393/g.54816  ORF Transcript_27393/g.54816 Transcript_27393/m.54816 type:complete len:263 (+) Transcript_27393:1081-1869(+)
MRTKPTEAGWPATNTAGRRPPRCSFGILAAGRTSRRSPPASPGRTPPPKNSRARSRRAAPRAPTHRRRRSRPPPSCSPTTQRWWPTASGRNPSRNSTSPARAVRTRPMCSCGTWSRCCWKLLHRPRRRRPPPRRICSSGATRMRPRREPWPSGPSRSDCACRGTWGHRPPPCCERSCARSRTICSWTARRKKGRTRPEHAKPSLRKSRADPTDPCARETFSEQLKEHTCGTRLSPFFSSSLPTRMNCSPMRVLPSIRKSLKI